VIPLIAALVILVTTGLSMWAVSSLLEALLKALFPSKKVGSDRALNTQAKRETAPGEP
jgi:hypothetical protein